MKLNLLATLALAFAAGLIPARAQINTGSDGHDGAFHPTQTTTVIDMANHPDGIYQYTSVNIPKGVVVTFKPNANNTPVVWLVQGSCVIDGQVSVAAQVWNVNTGFGGGGGAGGPGGYAGGSSAAANITAGQGPGGGRVGASGGNASYGTVGVANGSTPSGATYGNSYLLPLLGGSGGGGGSTVSGSAGGGGGGAILIAAPSQIVLNGSIDAHGGGGASGWDYAGGGGSGGAVRLVSTSIDGTGWIDASGGSGGGGANNKQAGNGRVRFDAVKVHLASVSGSFTQGFQPIIIPGQSQGVSLSIASIAGLGTPGSPKGQVNTPDVVVPALTANPVPVVVQCANVPLNTPVTVFALPTMGPPVQASAVNNAGTLASSTATISLNLPRGGGIIYASAVVGIGGLGAAADGGGKAASYAQTGLTAEGERFAKMEITAALGNAPQIAYITESGKKYALPAQ